MNRVEASTQHRTNKRRNFSLSSQFDFFLLSPETSFLSFQIIQRREDKFMVISVKQVSADKAEALRLLFLIPSLTLSPSLIYQNVFNHSSSCLVYLTLSSWCCYQSVILCSLHLILLLLLHLYFSCFCYFSFVS